MGEGYRPNRKQKKLLKKFLSGPNRRSGAESKRRSMRVALAAIAGVAGVGGAVLHQDAGDRLRAKEVVEFEQKAPDFARKLRTRATVKTEARVKQLMEVATSDSISIVPKTVHAGIKRSGDSIVADSSTPEIPNTVAETPLENPRLILVGELSYNGPLALEKLAGIGPDGKEFYKAINHEAAQFSATNGIIDFSTTGVVISGQSEFGITRVVIDYDSLLRAMHQADGSRVTVNGEAIDLPTLVSQPQIKGVSESAIDVFQDAIAPSMVEATSVTTEATTGHLYPGETANILQAVGINIGQTETGESVYLRGGASGISFE